MVSLNASTQYQVMLSVFGGLTLVLIAINSPTAAIAQSSQEPPAPNREFLSSPAASSTPPNQLNPEDYVLGAGDQIRVDVFRLPDYSGEYEVLINGVVNLPMVGQVPVGGLTLDQAKAAISQAYANRLRRPIVNISLISPRPLRVGIAGEVSRPGAYTLQREGTQFPSLVDALEVAGGITQSADLRQVVVRREIGAGAQQTIVVNLWQFLQTGDLEYNLALRDGDTVLIPTRENFNHQESLQLAAASFAADESRPLNIAVVGEVFRPGPYTVTGTARTGEAGVPGNDGGNNTPPTVTRAIQVAGGIKPEADIREIQVYRRTRDGREHTIRVDLWQLLTEGNLSEDIPLQEGDTVTVPKAEALPPEELTAIATASFSPDTISVNVVGEVESPGVIQVSPNTPLSQGILAAGGFNNRARRGTVELVRLNPDGTASRAAMPIDFAEGIDEEMNPLLRNNDIIIVRRSTSASISDTLDNVLTPVGRILSIFSLPSNLIQIFDRIIR